MAASGLTSISSVAIIEKDTNSDVMLTWFVIFNVHKEKKINSMNLGVILQLNLKQNLFLSVVLIFLMKLSHHSLSVNLIISGFILYLYL